MLSDDPQQHRLLADPSRRRILELLTTPDGPRDAHALAAVTGLHPTTVRSHLVQLRQAGLVTADRRHRETPGRPRTEYSVVPIDREPPSDPVYRELAGALVEGLAAARSGPEAAAAAGDAWGRRLVALHQGVMQGVLDETGDGRVVTSLTPFAQAGACVARLDPPQAV